jgi:Leucine-rich repeat (LRR) protein
MISQIVKACAETPGLVALRELTLVPKRLKASTAPAILPQLATLTCLRQLSFYKCLDLTWEHLSLCRGLLSSLPSLSIQGCEKLMQLDAIEANCSVLQNIQTLNIKHTSGPTLTHLTALALHLSTIQSLDLSGTSMASRPEVEFTNTLLPLAGSLKYLSLNAVFATPDFMSTQKCAQILRHLPNLEFLDARVACPAEIDFCLLPESPNLKEIRVHMALVRAS